MLELCLNLHYSPCKASSFKASYETVYPSTDEINNPHSCGGLVEAMHLGNSWARVWLGRRNKTVELPWSSDITHFRDTHLWFWIRSWSNSKPLCVPSSDNWRRWEMVFCTALFWPLRDVNKENSLLVNLFLEIATSLEMLNVAWKKISVCSRHCPCPAGIPSAFTVPAFWWLLAVNTCPSLPENIFWLLE